MQKKHLNIFTLTITREICSGSAGGGTTPLRQYARVSAVTQSVRQSHSNANGPTHFVCTTSLSSSLSGACDSHSAVGGWRMPMLWKWRARKANTFHFFLWKLFVGWKIVTPEKFVSDKFNGRNFRG